jgi:hypothetical protein
MTVLICHATNPNFCHGTRVKAKHHVRSLSISSEFMRMEKPDLVDLMLSDKEHINKYRRNQ